MWKQLIISSNQVKVGMGYSSEEFEIWSTYKAVAFLRVVGIGHCYSAHPSYKLFVDA